MFNNLVIAHFSVLIDIETFLLNTLVNAQAMNLLNTEEEDDTTGGSPEVYDENAETLSTKESPSVTIEGTVGHRQQTCHDGTQDTADTVYRRCTYGIVDVQFVIDKLNGIDEYDTTDESDDDGSPRRYEVTTSRDTHETCQHTVERH